MLLNDEELKCLISEWEVDYLEHSDFIKSIYKKCYEEINQFVKKPLKIDFKLDGNPQKIDARANEEEAPFVGVEYSFYLLLNKFYNTVFSEKNAKFYELITFNSEYNEKNAKSWSLFMKKLTLEVIIFHELGHIYGGHLKKGDASKFNASENDCGDKKTDILFLQAREIDADRFAAYNLVSYYVSDWNMNDSGKTLYAQFKNKEHVLSVLLYASILAFSILGAGRDNSVLKKDFKEISHFPSRYRAYCYYIDMVDAYNQNYTDNKVNLLEECDILKIIEAVEKWFDYYMRDVTGVNNWSPENNNNVFNEDHKEYYQRVVDYMENKFIQEINPNREGLARIKDIYITPDEVMHMIAKEDGGDFFQF